MVLIGVIAATGDEFLAIADFFAHLDLLIQDVVLVLVVHERRAAATVISADAAGVAAILRLLSDHVVVEVVEEALQVSKTRKRLWLGWVRRKDVSRGGANDLYNLIQLVDRIIGGDAATVYLTDHVSHLVILVKVTDIGQSRVGAGVADGGAHSIAGDLLKVTEGICARARRRVSTISIWIILRVVLV